MKKMKMQYKPLSICQLLIIVILFNFETIAEERNITKKKPHIILIIADDMGWNDASFHGADQIPTPNIDALAYNGVILNRHYVLPACTPSRSALLTGRYPIRYGLQGGPLKAGEPSGLPLNEKFLPEYLRKLGYATQLVGKWHVGYYTNDHTPVHRGFDNFFGYYNGRITYFNHTIYQNANNKVLVGHDLHRDTSESLKAAYRTGYFTDIVAEEAEKIIRDNGNDKPLFLEISHLAVHASGSVNPLEVRNMTAVNETFSYIQDVKRRKYAGMLQALDESIGKVMTALSETNMLENSIVIFLSDNGAPTIGVNENTGSNYPLRGMKNTLFEGGVRGLACIFSPLIKSPARVSERSMHITDWLPTLYAAAGGNSADLRELDGFNLWPHIVNDSTSPRDSLLINIDEKKNTSAAIIGKFKLIQNATGFKTDYYGVSGNNPSYPKYKFEDVLLSPAGVAISRLNNFTEPSLDKMKTLREKSRVLCKPETNYAKCSNSCLFDIQNDPCETKDLSEQYPTVAGKLKIFINEYQKILKPQINVIFDPRSYCKYFNGTLMPWRKN